jgi:N-acetylmuramoyl-L-alanine amidase
MRNSMPCVGLIVLVGSLTFIMTPDDEPSAPRRTLSKRDGLPTVVIDPGHGGRDEGARSHGLVEKALTLDLAVRMDKRLRVAGFPTLLTRNDDRYVSLAERARIGNRYDDSVFVSLHFNKTSNSSASGVETYYETEKVTPEAAWTWIGFFNKPEPDIESGEELAAYVQTALAVRLDATNRGIKRRDLYVVRHVRAPAILVEAGFLSSPIESRLLANPAYRERLAASLAEGVMGYVKSRPQPREAPRLVKNDP